LVIFVVFFLLFLHVCWDFQFGAKKGFEECMWLEL
jgi:hypothetical protein